MVNLKLEIHPKVFLTSASLIVLFVLLTLLNLSRMSQVFELVQEIIATRAGWFYILSINIYLALVIYLMFSRFGKVRLGGPDARPDFSYWSWFSMLFSAGMGIGLVFYSVAEPITHYSTPPVGQGSTPQAAQLAMNLTFFHWGLHAWGLYALMGLGLAFFCFNHGLPLTVRAAFYPLLGGKVHGWPGDVVDILATVSTVFGLATSLGLGARQINAGLAHLLGIPQNTGVQITLIFGITAIALASVVLGLRRGIRRLSQFNMVMAFLLLAFLLWVGPTVVLFRAFLENIGTYMDRLPALGLWTGTYGTGQNWQSNWTIFYWAWWISWSPFVGIFVARISRGRTVREFLGSVLIVPTLLTFVWLTVFGNTALFEEVLGSGGIVEAVNENVATALFVLLDKFPLSTLTCSLAVIVIAVFFVTSSDSASLVVDIITAGGNLDPPVIQRVFWASMEGVVAAVLLHGGGLQALQTAVMITGLPFSIVLLALGYSLLKGLFREEREQKTTASERK